MEIRSLVKRGTDHHVYCEDDLFSFNDGNTYIAAIFDGCSTGIKSHFASTLYSKILKCYCEDRFPEPSPISLELEGRMIYKYLFRALGDIQGLLSLNTLEMLSTMILVVYRDNKAYVLVSGDGCILVDGIETKIESAENAPDYLAYHLNDSMEGFMSLKELHFDVNIGLSICSDGIYSFRNSSKETATNRVIQSLLVEDNLLASEAMLSRKYNLLLKEGYSNYDDVSIVRFINS